MPPRASGHQLLQLLANYWEKRSYQYDSPEPDVFGRNIVGAYLRKLQPKSLIEVGCGTGQLFSLYKTIPRVVGAYWTDGMLNQSRKRLVRHEYDNIKLVKLDITKQYLPEKFDVAITRTVLMHLPEEDRDDKGKLVSKLNPTEEACRNLCAMSDTVVLFEFYDPNAPNLDWKCFHHEYPLFMRALGYQISELFDRPDGLRQMLMVFKRATT